MNQEHPTYSLLGTTHDKISAPLSFPSLSLSNSLSNFSFSIINHSLSWCLAENKKIYVLHVSEMQRLINDGFKFYIWK